MAVIASRGFASCSRFPASFFRRMEGLGFDEKRAKLTLGLPAGTIGKRQRGLTSCAIVG